MTDPYLALIHFYITFTIYMWDIFVFQIAPEMHSAVLWTIAGNQKLQCQLLHLDLSNKKGEQTNLLAQETSNPSAVDQETSHDQTA